MERRDFYYPAEAESLGGIPTGTRAGQFLFLSTQTPINLDTGQVIRRLEDLPLEERAKVALGNAQLNVDCGPIRAQTWTIYQNLSKILAQQNSSLENIVQQRIYLADKTDTRHMEEVMLSFFPDYKPTTMIAAVPNQGLHDGIRVIMDAIALVPQKDGLQREAIHLPELEAVTAPYPQAVRAGKFLFMGEMMGINPETGQLVTSFADLDQLLGPDAPKTRTGRVHSDRAQEALNAQWWLIWKHFQRVLESQGAGLGDFMTANGYVRSSMKELHMREPLRVEFFKGRPDWSPGGATPCIHDLSVIPGVELIFGAVGIVPDEHQSEKGKPVASAMYTAWAKAEPFFFGAGTGGLDAERQRRIMSFADIIDKGRWLAHGRIDDSQAAMAEAWFTYESNVFGRMPFKPSQVVHQTVHLCNPSDWPAVERVAEIIFDGRIPATTVVPVDAIGFYYRESPTPELLRPLGIEIQVEGIIE